MRGKVDTLQETSLKFVFVLRGLEPTYGGFLEVFQQFFLSLSLANATGQGRHLTPKASFFGRSYNRFKNHTQRMFRQLQKVKLRLVGFRVGASRQCECVRNTGSVPVGVCLRDKPLALHFLSLRAPSGAGLHATSLSSLSLRGGSRRGRRGNPVRVVAGAAYASAGLPRRLRSSQ